MKRVGLVACLLGFAFVLGRPGPFSLREIKQKQRQTLGQEHDHVAIKDGKKEYVKNDMGFDRKQYIEMFGKDPEKTFERRPKRSAIVSNTARHWTNGTVPTVLNITDWDKDERDVLLDVISFLEAETCLTFPNKTADDKNWLKIENCDYWDSGCWSMVGMEGVGEQPVCLGDGCQYPGTYIHEIGHALGLIHEHQRDDRDAYVKINFKNIEPGEHHQFDKVERGSVIKTGYDFEDAMHYERTAFSKNPAENLYTITANDTSKNRLIERTKDYILFDYHTIRLLNQVYNCSASCNATEIKDCASKKGGFINGKCECITPIGFEWKQCKDWYKDCSYWSQDHCKSDDWGEWMKLFCRASCMACTKEKGKNKKN